MKKISETVVFFGSGPVAAQSLELLAKDFPIEAVITKPRAQRHRGDVPVIATAGKLELPIHTVADKKSLDKLLDSKPFTSRLAVLIDFGIIVSQQVIDYFPLGIINSHFSLLPQWRGADPITFSILSGQEQTGVSLMLLTAGMDEGPILAQGVHELTPQTTTPDLTDYLIKLSHALLLEVIPRYIRGEARARPQELVTQAKSKIPSYSRKLTKEDGLIDWRKPASQIEREIRAFAGWPKSRTTLAGKDVVITKASVAAVKGEPGSIKATQRSLLVYCGEQALAIEQLKPAGKNEMSMQAFLAGYGKQLEL